MFVWSWTDNIIGDVASDSINAAVCTLETLKF